MVKNKDLQEYRAGVLKALSDPVRLEIVEFLKGRERCVCEIIPMLGRSQSTTSKNLDILYRTGILDRRVEGKRTLYRIKNPRVFSLLKETDNLALDQLSSLSKTAKMLKESLKGK
jgi:ArsR family transcriptional regulator